MDPRYRLKRKYPGESLLREDSLGARMVKRWTAEKPLRTVAGESFQARVRKTRDSRLYVRPEPNAPLLKRICKNPYQERARRGKRTKVRSPVPWTFTEERGLSEPVMTSARKFAGSVVFGCPINRPDFRRQPPPRVRPSVDDWLSRTGDSR